MLIWPGRAWLRWPDDVLARIAAMAQAQAGLPLPEGVGRSVGLRHSLRDDVEGGHNSD